MYLRISAKQTDEDNSDQTVACHDGALILCAKDGWPIAVQVEIEEPKIVREEFTSLVGTTTTTTNAEIKAWFNDIREANRIRLQHATDTFRWRTGRSDITTTASHLWIRISTNGADWHPPPVDFSEIRIGIIGVPFRTDDTEQLASARELLRTGKEQPLSHELLREAWSQCDVSPRSAIVLAVAAIEVGLKTYIADRVPKAAWLIENLQSPPLDRLIEKYIDQLTPTYQFSNKPIRPPAILVKALKEAIELRNRIVHRGEGTLSQEKINSILVSTRDLLYILDVYEGAQWAAEHIRPETMTAWSAAKQK